MKQSFRILCAAAVLGAVSITGASAMEGEGGLAASSETPLMVIRFNQPHVDYPMPLYNTLFRTLEVKQSATFDVVSVSPKAQVEHNQPYYDQLTAEKTNKVLGTLHEIGLPAQRLHVTNTVEMVSAPEVRIYVH